MQAPAQFVNIAAYKFITFDNTEEMRPKYQEICARLGLKGTILLTPEMPSELEADLRSIDPTASTWNRLFTRMYETSLVAL